MHEKEKIGIVYHPDYLIHTNQNHPERKERLEAIWKVLESEQFQDTIRLIDPEHAEPEEIKMIHTQEYLSSIEQACNKNQGSLDLDTYIVSESYSVALLAAGGALRGLKEVMEKDISKVVSLIRPPGHHAEINRAMGFCLFNNIAIAARKAQKYYDLERVAIIDWDVHHGNGTQNAFYDDPGVLFISIHQSPAYPGTGYIEETGRGEGEGYNINIPLPGGSGNQDYLQVFYDIVIPVLQEYQPQLIMVSAGQDSHEQDPLAGMNLTEEGFYYMATALKEQAKLYASGRMLICLEGGYHLQAQAKSVGKIVEALSVPEAGFAEYVQTLKFGESTSKRIDQVKRTIKHFWNSLD